MAVSSMRIRRVHLVLGALASFLIAGSSVHCAADGDTAAGGFPAGGAGGNASSGNGSGNGSGVGGVNFDADIPDYSPDQFFEDDPPPTGCDGGGQPPTPGGSPECPDDKNLEGCPCPAEGATAACWPGKRKNRDHGVCHDGVATCVVNGEVGLAWGPCVGAQLPTGTEGKAACLCFSGGHWDIANLSPCFFSTNGTTVAISTVVVNGQPECPASADAPPAEPWSDNTLKTDCSGYFKLCYALKAGDGASPQPNDCEIIKVCTESYYSPANSIIPFPPLPSWLSAPGQGACVQQFIDSGGYGEMSVSGESDECDHVDKVFQHVTYCPLSCNDPNPPPECAMCQPGGGGDF